MPKSFKPQYTITPKIAQALMRIEAAKEAVNHLPMTPTLLKRLRETARLYSTHYSTMIEGNRLTQEEVDGVIKKEAHFPGRERDEFEVKGYYTAFDQLEKYAARKSVITEKTIQTLHALVMAGGKKNVKLSVYRDGQNVIREGLTGRIIYLPPEAKDVLKLMNQLVMWIQKADVIPVPIIAGIAHYQFATIHPYYDGNGRTARLLTTLILHLGYYDLKGLYALEEYYAKNLAAYYDAISVGPSHNYYMGRAESDITDWIEYFCEGVAESFEKVKEQASQEAEIGAQDHSPLLRLLDIKQRKALELFQEFQEITSVQIAELFGFKARTASHLCQQWVGAGFLLPVNLSRKARKYQLGKKYRRLQ